MTDTEKQINEKKLFYLNWKIQALEKAASVIRILFNPFYSRENEKSKGFVWRFHLKVQKKKKTNLVSNDKKVQIKKKKKS